MTHVGRIKVIEFEGPNRTKDFEKELDSQMHNERVRIMQYGVIIDKYYIIYESIHEGSPYAMRKRS